MPPTAASPCTVRRARASCMCPATTCAATWPSKAAGIRPRWRRAITSCGRLARTPRATPPPARASSRSAWSMMRRRWPGPGAGHAEGVRRGHGHSDHPAMRGSRTWPAMRRMTLPRLLLPLLLLVPPAARAQSTLDTLDEAMAGPSTRVLVLATAHLGQDGVALEPVSLDGLLDRLAGFAPQIITIEAMPGDTCDLMARHSTVYGGGTTAYCPDTSAARAATGLDIPAAMASAQAQLDDWPQAPSPAQRRRLAATLLAAGDPTSALVQWLQLPQAGRVAGDGLDATLVESLRTRARRNGENTRIAAALAVRLGLQRVHPTDDHTGDSLRIDDENAFAAALRVAWDGAPAHCGTLRARADTLRAGEDLLPLYRYLNSADYQAAWPACDFGAALADPSPQRFGRQYVAGWELRNLRMVANIGATFRERPGARVLSIVGASHKPWFDRALGQLQGVQVVDAVQVLAD